MKSKRRTNDRRATGGWIGLLAGATAMGVYVAAGLSGAPAAAQEEAAPSAAPAASRSSGSSTPPPSERIDVEQAVDFPYDI